MSGLVGEPPRSQGPLEALLPLYSGMEPGERPLWRRAAPRLQGEPGCLAPGKVARARLAALWSRRPPYSTRVRPSPAGLGLLR